MTQEIYSAFMKIAADDLASTLSLKYQRAVQAANRQFGIKPVSMNRSSPSGGALYNNYLKSIMTQESAGKYNVVNKSSGALGLYQFMPNTLTGLGYKGTRQQFLNNPALQHKYMNIFTRQNAKKLGIDINKMNLQQAGYLAAAHYGGVGGAQKIMSGNHRYGNKQFYGKSPYSYINDVITRIRKYGQ